MEQNEKARYKKWFPFTTYDLDELNNRDIKKYYQRGETIHI